MINPYAQPEYVDKLDSCYTDLEKKLQLPRLTPCMRKEYQNRMILIDKQRAKTGFKA